MRTTEQLLDSLKGLDQEMYQYLFDELVFINTIPIGKRYLLYRDAIILSAVLEAARSSCSKEIVERVMRDLNSVMLKDAHGRYKLEHLTLRAYVAAHEHMQEATP